MSIELGKSPLRLYAPGFLHLSAAGRTRQDSRGRALKRRFGGLVPVHEQLARLVLHLEPTSHRRTLPDDFALRAHGFANSLSAIRVASLSRHDGADCASCDLVADGPHRCKVGTHSAIP
jgi:hypothetical protein